MEVTSVAKEITIKIRIFEIDGKKLTRSLFNQIIEENPPFSDDFEWLEGERLGYIKEKYHWVILFTNANDQLRKSELNDHIVDANYGDDSEEFYEENPYFKKSRDNVLIIRSEMSALQVFI